MDPLTLLLVGFGVYILFKANPGPQDASLTYTTPDDGTDGSYNGGLVMPPLGNLSAAAIAQLAANAGFQGNDLIVATAIALAESSGNPGVVGDLSITPGGSVGLWQINLRWHPEYTAAALVNPQTNANAAYAVYRAAGNSFSPWSTFKNGMYTAHLDQAQGGADVLA